MTPSQIAAKDFHVHCSAEEEEGHEDSLRWNVNALDWWSTWSPYCRRIWRNLATRLYSVRCWTISETQIVLTVEGIDAMITAHT
jgi:hypothetical protein